MPPDATVHTSHGSTEVIGLTGAKGYDNVGSKSLSFGTQVNLQRTTRKEENHQQHRHIKTIRPSIFDATQAPHRSSYKDGMQRSATSSTSKDLTQSSSSNGYSSRSSRRRYSNARSTGSTAAGTSSISDSGNALIHRRLSTSAARNMSSMRRNSFEVFDGYSSKEIMAGLRSRRASDQLSVNGTTKGVDIEQSNSAREYVTWLMDEGDKRSQYGKYNEALLAFREALRVQEMMLGKAHAETATTLTRIGGVLGQMNEISEALTSLTEALRIHRLRRGEHPELVAHTFQVTGVVYKRSGDLDKAMASYKEALRLRKQVVGDDDAEVAITYHNIGNIHYEQGHFMAAMEAYIMCVNSCSPLTKGNVHTASKLHKIGVTLCQLNLFDHGLRAYKEALRVRKLTLEHDNLDIASTLQGMADVFERKGELEQALCAYTEAFSIMHKQLGSSDPDVVEVINRIGTIKSYLKSGAWRKICKELKRKSSN